MTYVRNTPQTPPDGSLFALSRRENPSTSRAAAKAVARSGAKARHEDAIVRTLERIGNPMTTAEIAEASGCEGLDNVAVGKRMRSLVDAGRAVEVGKRVCRIRERQTLVYTAPERSEADGASRGGTL